MLPINLVLKFQSTLRLFEVTVMAFSTFRSMNIELPEPTALEDNCSRVSIPEFVRFIMIFSFSDRETSVFCSWKDDLLCSTYIFLTYKNQYRKMLDQNSIYDEFDLIKKQIGKQAWWGRSQIYPPNSVFLGSWWNRSTNHRILKR